MDNGTYKRNVFKTLPQREAKLGLKFVARNTRRTNAMQAVSRIAGETLELVKVLGPYMVGSVHINDAMKIAAFDKASELTYSLMVAAKVLKVKVPGSGKKIKLKGQTRSEAVVKLAGLAAEMFALSNQVYSGPSLMDKEVVRKNKEGVVTKMTVKAVDMDVSEAEAANREHLIAASLSQYLELFWAVCFDTFEVPPANLYVAQMAKLEKQWGKKFFDVKPKAPAGKAKAAKVAKAKKETPQAVEA